MTKDSAITPNNKPIVALDCDGVLLDYHTTFAQTYEKAFGKRPTIVSPTSYHSRDVYGIEFSDEEKDQFEQVWRKEAWKTMPVLDGSLQACLLLHEAGYELVCVTAMPSAFLEHRLENFRLHGFPIDRIICTGYDTNNFLNNPKRQTIEDLHPVAFVDDLRRNFKDIQGVHTKLVFIDRQCHDDPNLHDNIYYDVKYSSLLEFVKDFLRSEQHGEEISWSERPSHLLSFIVD